MCVFCRESQLESRSVGVREGLGLGLTVSHELIRASGGQLTVESEVGEGTTIKILLPEGHRVVRDSNETLKAVSSTVNEDLS